MPECTLRRVKAIQVECYAGYQADQEPRAFVVDGDRRTVLGVADRWRDPESSSFKVRADDGHQYLLRHHRATDAWTLVKVFPAVA